MRRIAQRDFEAGACGIACAAMISGRTYDEAHAIALKLGLRANAGTYFTCHKDLVALLNRLGKSCIRKRFNSIRKVTTPAIVKVNPKKSGKYWHWIVVTGSSKGEIVILDPKPGKLNRIKAFRGYKGTGQYLHVA